MATYPSPRKGNTYLPNRMSPLTKTERRTLIRYARRVAKQGLHHAAGVLYAAAGCSYTVPANQGG